MQRKVFGKQVAYFRKKLNLTQEELATKVQCAVSTISRIECGIECPRVEIFDKITSIFEHVGFSYDELKMENILEFDKAKDELLAAIHEGREEILDRKLSRFEELMVKDNVEHQQYYALGYLICMRKRGMSVEEYLDRCIELFELGRKIPTIEDLPMLNLTKIEHMLIYEYAKSHYELGETVIAEKMLAALLENSFYANTEYHKDRCKSMSTAFAKIMLKKKDYYKAQKCMSYLFERITRSFDARNLMKGLKIQHEIFECCDNEEGMKIIDDFLESSERMFNYIYVCTRNA